MIIFYNYPKQLNSDQKKINSLSFVFTDIIRHFKTSVYCFCSFFNTVLVFFYECLQKNGRFFSNKTI